IGSVSHVLPAVGLINDKGGINRSKPREFFWTFKAVNHIFEVVSNKRNGLFQCLRRYFGDDRKLMLSVIKECRVNRNRSGNGRIRTAVNHAAIEGYTKTVYITFVNVKDLEVRDQRTVDHAVRTKGRQVANVNRRFQLHL